MEMLFTGYKRLKEDEFRILLLHQSRSEDDMIDCTLETVGTDTPLAYTALSYTWGDVQDTDFMRLDYEVIEVQANLTKALKQMRKLQYYVVWADAICINQDDIQERNAQVSAMRSIYEKAQEVVVCQSHGRKLFLSSNLVCGARYVLCYVISI